MPSLFGFLERFRKDLCHETAGDHRCFHPTSIQDLQESPESEIGSILPCAERKEIGTVRIGRHGPLVHRARAWH